MTSHRSETNDQFHPVPQCCGWLWMLMGGCGWLWMVMSDWYINVCVCFHVCVYESLVIHRIIRLLLLYIYWSIYQLIYINLDGYGLSTWMALLWMVKDLRMIADSCGCPTHASCAACTRALSITWLATWQFQLRISSRCRGNIKTQPCFWWNTVDGRNPAPVDGWFIICPIIDRGSTIQGGAGSLPSIVIM